MKGFKIAWLSGFFVALFLLLSLLAPYLPIPNPGLQDLAAQYAPASKLHWLGQGENGVDMLSQLLWGARLSLGIALGSVVASAAIGILLGSTAGYLRGYWDDALLRIIEVLQAFPGILLIVTLAVLLGPSLRNLLIIMIVTSWTSYARLARALTLTLRERGFVQASVALGASPTGVLTRHIWPHLLTPIFIQMTYGMGGAVLTESSLSFLGLGAPPGTPSWGQMLNQGRDVILSATHVILVPGLALVLSILALNFFGDGLRDYLDPKMIKT